MTFRPSDDVLDKIQEESQSSLEQNSGGNQGDGGHIFNNFEKDSNIGGDEDLVINPIIANLAMEEVKAPDLSELLKNSGKDDTGNDNVIDLNESEGLHAESMTDVTISEETPFIKSEEKESDNKGDVDTTVAVDNRENNEKEESKIQNIENETEQQDILNDESEDKIQDTERSDIVSEIEGSIHSKLDFLVDNDWFNIVKKYKKINCLFFRWGIFIFATIIGIVSGGMLQANDNHANSIDMLDEGSIENKSKWIEETADKLLFPLVEDGAKIDVSIPYGAVSVDGTNFQSKSNLIFYKGVVLPQLSSIDYNSEDFLSLEDFNLKNISRENIKSLINLLITNNSIYKKTTDILNATDLRWLGNKFGGSLIGGFSLGCVDDNKVSDFVCDAFLENFYKYGKYYDLNEYASELFGLTIDLKRQGKDIEPICNMVKEYTLHAGSTSDMLISIMDYCGEDDVAYYKKLVDFIDVENSLGQPNLSNKVFDDPDLNAYKLLSAQQNVYKIVDGTSLNEGYIKSYLEFVQSLINKDKGSNRYLQPIYKDLLYVFNMDEIYQKLMQKGKLSSDLKLQIDQINNGNSLGSVSLLSQLTTSDIVQVESDFTGLVAEEKTTEELFSQYYAMTDRLKIRKADFTSDDTIKVQTEVFTDAILSVTNGVTLKVTVMLHRQDNLLYVDTIKVANQPKLTDILNIYVSDGDVTFYAILNYIDEQVGMWYEGVQEDVEQQPTFCEEMMEREDIVVYTCDDSSISLYKGEVEYNFTLLNGILESFTISDENLENIIKDKLNGVLFMKDSTPSIVNAIIEFSVESEDESIEKKLEIINQFRIHFKIVPNDIYNVEGNSDLFLINFTLGEFDMQGYYDVNTHTLTKIAYLNCKKPLEIKDLSLEITSENESQLIEILNNPRVFLATVNPSVYKKYLKACGGNTVDKK